MVGWYISGQDIIKTETDDCDCARILFNLPPEYVLSSITPGDDAGERALLCKVLNSEGDATFRHPLFASFLQIPFSLASLCWCHSYNWFIKCYF